MIVLFGPAGDEVISFLVLRLLSLDEPFELIDPHQINTGQLDVSWHPTSGGALQHGSRRLALDSVRSIYLREFTTYDNPRPELTSALLALTEHIDVLVLNRASGSSSNASKPYQARWIEEHGFRSPPTLLTTDAEAARAFYDEHAGRVIHKSVSGLRSIVVQTSDADLQRIELVHNCPTQFQALVPGTDVRVHVVGDRVFATEIRTTAIDYRYSAAQGAERHMRDYELPDDIAERCIRLSRALGMGLTGIDLRRDPDGSWWCFEVNPSPGFTFYQAFTGQPIGQAVVELLRRG